jgi:hypothetical protein
VSRRIPSPEIASKNIDSSSSDRRAELIFDLQNVRESRPSRVVNESYVTTSPTTVFRSLFSTMLVSADF